MVRRILAPSCVALTFLVLAACQNPGAWSDPSRHKNGFVTANGIRINYLDWGGSGPALILIHGLADNPHVFDDLAPAFTDRYRVVSYARRGHGESEAKPPYDVATLTEDLRVLMDSLGIAKASLVGWSMGGDEVTAMASAHPERVDRIVYIEGAYDWSDSAFVAAFKVLPYDLNPPAGALTSLDAFRAYEKTDWLPAVSDGSRYEAYVRDLVAVQPNGSVQLRMSDSVGQAVFAVAFAYRRDYSKIHAPALAIFAQTFLNVRVGDSAQRAKTLAWEQRYMAPFRAATIERVRRELPGIEIVNVPGTHTDFIFVSRDSVVAAMRRFLGES